MRWISLLRGVNVGGHRKVPMADLRDVARGLGWGDAATYIQSGNLVFSARGKAESIAARLEEAIAERFGFQVDVVVRSAEQWAGYAGNNPFPEASSREPNRVFLVLGRESPDPKRGAALRERATGGEAIEFAGDAVWIHYAAGMGKTQIQSALIDRLLGMPTTARNWRTVLALRGLVAGS